MIAGLAVADFRERVRRPAYAMVVLAAIGLGYLAAPGPDSRWVILNLGEFRAVYNSAFIGTVTAFAGALWLMLGGFYLVRNAIGRDERTGVGQLLAATPVSRARYLMGKFISNLMVLGSMAAVLAGTALVMQLARGESRSVDPVALALPFVLLTLPVLAFTAAAAVLFETVPLLRGGIGNVAWFFVWMVLGIAGQGAGAPLGGIGTGYVAESMRASVIAGGADLSGADFSVGLMYLDHPLRTFVWPGLHVHAGFLVDRLALVLLASVLAMLPALWFHRFDTARGNVAVTQAVPPPSAAPTVYIGPPRTMVRRGNTFGRLLVGELRILVQGLSLWWWLGAAVLTLVGLVAPPMTLALTWIWPVLVWSRLGTQRVEAGMDALLGAYPAGYRRVLAEWAAAIAFTAAAGAGPAVRMAATGDTAGLAAWTAGALFIPSLALALGTVSRTHRLFQAVYVPLWYLVVNDVAALDYMGVIREAGRPAGPAPAVIAGIGLALLAAVLAVSWARHARR